MLEEKEIITAEENEEINKELDKSLVALPLQLKENEIIGNIIEAPTKEELQQQFELFNINQSKKNALRVIKLTNLLNKVEDEVIDRFEKRPDQVSNRELIDYMTVVSNQIDRTQRLNMDTLSAERPAIRNLTQKNEVNININEPLNRDEKEKVVDAVTALLKQIRKPGTQMPVNDDVIDVEELTPVENYQNNDQEIVYNNDILNEENESEV